MRNKSENFKVVQFVLFLIAVLVAGAGFDSIDSQPPHPEAILSNGILKAKVLLPDAEKGYYRGSRFDWAGVISELTYEGHSYFGPWFSNYDPFHHDAIQGPVDEFREPLGFDEATAGGEFVKIGVGVLKKPDDKKYSFARKYELTDPGVWKLVTLDSQVLFSQDVHSENGYGYSYKKIVRLAKDEPRLVLEHRLTNTGKQEIKTNTYNHNFFVIDQEPTGPNIRTRFAFDISGEGQGFGDLADVSENTLKFNRRLNKGEHVFSADLRKDKSIPVPYDLTVENTKTKAGVRITGDKTIDTMVYWASATTACPEPYIDINLKPGESVEWTINYDFYKLK